MYLLPSHGSCLWIETKWESAKTDWLTANHCSSFEYAIRMYIRKALLTLEGKKEQYMANQLSIHQALIWDHCFVITVEWRCSSKNHFKVLYKCFFWWAGVQDLPDFSLDLGRSLKTESRGGKTKRAFSDNLSACLFIPPRKLLLEQAFLHSNWGTNDTVRLSVVQFPLLASWQAQK